MSHSLLCLLIARERVTLFSPDICVFACVHNHRRDFRPCGAPSHMGQEYAPGKMTQRSLSRGPDPLMNCCRRFERARTCLSR